MSADCPNDCSEPERFPQRPFNRPGLDRIRRRIGTYTTLRDFLLRRLNGEPTLAAWTHRGADDPGIALLEGAAILGDILTFYQELYANEAYLGTARWRDSIAELVRLLGYRLSPGVGGRATFALAVRGDRPVVVPKGFPLSAQLTGIDEQVDFETAAELTALPWLSRFHLYRPLATPDVSATTSEFYIDAPDPVAMPVALEAGDRLLVGDRDVSVNPVRLANAEIVVLHSVRQQLGRTLFRIKGALTRSSSAAQLAAYKLGRSFRHFGHNAPHTMVTLSAGVATERATEYLRSLGDRVTSSEGADRKRLVDPELRANEYPLDSEVDNLPSGAAVLIQGTVQGASQPFSAECHIAAVESRSMTWGSVSGGSTVLTIAPPLGPPSTALVPSASPSLDIRTVRLHETRSPLLTLRAAPVPTAAATGHDAYFLGVDDEVQAMEQRRLLLVRPDRDPQPVVVQSVETLPAALAERRVLRRVTVDAILDYADFPIDPARVEVYGNLVDATQGKSARETALGNGDARQTFQTFKLPKAPLTYLTSIGATPPEVPELQIYVADRLWTRVDAFFGRRPTDQIYLVREDAAGDSWVQFGDGETGARPPSGVDNVVARWRTGVGAHGALKEGTTVQAGAKLDRLDKIAMPDLASGGEAPESGAHARSAAPGKVQSLDRLVSLRDFESEALAVPGVALAAAAWALAGGVPAVVITVLMETGRAAELAQVRKILAGYNRCRGPQRFPVVIQQGQRRYVYLDVSFTVAADHRAELVQAMVAAALGAAGTTAGAEREATGLFALATRRFGEPEYASRIEGVVQNVDGVIWTRVNGLGSLAVTDDPLVLVPPATPWPRSAVVGCGAAELLALHTAHLQLRPVLLPTAEECA